MLLNGQIDLSDPQEFLDYLEFRVEQTYSASGKPARPYLQNNVQVDLIWPDKETADSDLSRLRDFPGVTSLVDKAMPGKACVQMTAPFETWKTVLLAAEPVFSPETKAGFSSASKPVILADLMRDRRTSPWAERFPLRTRTRHHRHSTFSHMKIG